VAKALKSLLGEPLVHFLLLGALLFAGYSIFKPGSQRRVVLAQKELQERVQERQKTLGHPLSDEERKAIVDEYAEEMILLNEAKLLNLNHGDEPKRDRLLQLARERLDEVVPEPTRQQLESYFQQHSSQYRMGAWVSFDQVFFAPKSPATPANPDSFLALLASKDDASSLGEADPVMGNHLSELTRSQLKALFGEAFADTLFALPESVWRGPLGSKYGTHYVRVVEHHEAPMPRFEDVQAFLRKDWKAMKHREIQDEKLQELRHEYTIVSRKD
jgi:parvulin-like peptidyl-prolyl isomerase